MKKQDNFRYEAPLSRVVVFKSEGLVCFSGNSGTESVGMSGSSYTDSDFE